MKTISTQQSRSNIEKVLAILAETPAKLEHLRKCFTDEQLQQPLAPGERSFLETLAHLLRSDARFPETIYLALFAEDPLFARIHTERDLGKLLHFEEHLVPDLLEYYKYRRKIVLQVLASLSDEQWSRVIREESKKRQESIYWRARGIALHEHEHFTDLESKLSKRSL